MLRTNEPKLLWGSSCIVQGPRECIATGWKHLLDLIQKHTLDLSWTSQDDWVDWGTKTFKLIKRWRMVKKTEKVLTLYQLWLFCWETKRNNAISESKSHFTITSWFFSAYLGVLSSAACAGVSGMDRLGVSALVLGRLLLLRRGRWAVGGLVWWTFFHHCTVSLRGQLGHGRRGSVLQDGRASSVALIWVSGTTERKRTRLEFVEFTIAYQHRSQLISNIHASEIWTVPTLLLQVPNNISE